MSNTNLNITKVDDGYHMVLPYANEKNIWFYLRLIWLVGKFAITSVIFIFISYAFSSVLSEDKDLQGGALIFFILLYVISFVVPFVLGYIRVKRFFLEELGSEELTITNNALIYNRNYKRFHSHKYIKKQKVEDILFNDNEYLDEDKRHKTIWWFIRLKLKRKSDYTYIGKGLARDDAQKIFDLLNEWHNEDYGK